MSYLLDVKEILEFAVYIEQRGYEFYVGAMKKFNEPQATRLFQYLADEEFKHEKIFKHLMQQGGDVRQGSADPEHQAYLKEYCKAHALGDHEAINEKLARFSTLNEILDLAMGFEKDSIVFFTELKELFVRSQAGPLDTIIREEMVHLRTIFQMKQGLAH